MADVEKLTVTLEANLKGFNDDLARATRITTQQTSAMESRFADLNKAVGTGFAKASQSSLSASQRIALGMSASSIAAGNAAKASQLLVSGLSQSTKGAIEAGEAVRLSGAQVAELGHIARSTFGVLLAGGGIFQALGYEANRIVSVLTIGQGGVGGTLKAIGGIVSSLFTPFRLAIAGFAGLGTAVLASALSFSSAQNRISLALKGIGSSAGVTVGQINQIGEAVSKSGDLSTSEATDIATAIASTGRASAESTEQATALAHAYSLVFNKDLNKSAVDLAQAIADPGSAIDALNGRLGAWSANQVELVKNLTLSGEREKAAKIIIEGMQKSIGDAAAKTDFWTRSWTKLTNAISNAITASGKAINEAAGIRTPEDALAIAQARLAALQNGRAGPRGGTTFGTPQEIAAARAEVDKLTKSIEAKNRAEQDSRGDAEVSAIIKDIDPTIQKLDELQATITRIKNQPITDEAALGVRDKVVASLQSEHDFLASNLELARQRYGVASAELGIASKANALEIAAINARTPAQKADIAYQQTLNQLLASGKGQREAEIEASFQRTKTLTEAQHQLSEAQRERIYQSQQASEQAVVENSTIGRSVDVAARLTKQFELLAAAKAEAFRNGTKVSATEQLNALIKADEAGRQALKDANDRLAADQNFDRAQIGRDSTEQQVYGRLQAAGLLDNGQIVSAQAKMRAEQERFNITLAQTLDIEKGFASSFLHDLIQGKSAAEALGDALNQVANKLLDMGIDKLISGTFGGGGATGIASLFGFADGGVFVPGKGPQKLKTYAGGGVSNTAAIFGEAGPEAAIPLKGGKVPVDLRMPKVAATARSTPNVTISIDARNSTKESVDALNANTLPKIREIVRSEILQTANRSAAFKKAVRS